MAGLGDKFLWNFVQKDDIKINKFCHRFNEPLQELPSFLKAVKKLFSEDDKRKLYTSLTNNPEQGDIIQGTSGVRKMRFALGNKGKSGGSRVIYYLYSP